MEVGLKQIGSAPFTPSLTTASRISQHFLLLPLVFDALRPLLLRTSADSDTALLNSHWPALLPSLPSPQLTPLSTLQFEQASESVTCPAT